MSDLEPLDGEPGPARPIDEARARELVARAMAAAQPARRARWPLGIAIGASFVVAAAAIGGVWWSGREAAVVEDAATAPVDGRARSKPIRRRTRPAQAAETSTLGAGDGDAGTALGPPVERTGPRRVRRDARARPIEPAKQVVIEPPISAPSPEDLLRSANALRGERRWVDAEAAFQRVIATHPGSPSAYVASAAAGALHLEHLRDPRGALALFGAARTAQPQGPLDPEIRLGIARAHEALGRPEEADRAWTALVEAHPGTPQADVARARLAR